MPQDWTRIYVDVDWSDHDFEDVMQRITFSEVPGLGNTEASMPMNAARQAVVVCAAGECETVRYPDSRDGEQNPGYGYQYYDNRDERHYQWFCIDHMYEAVQCQVCNLWHTYGESQDRNGTVVCVGCAPSVTQCPRCGNVGQEEELEPYDGYPDMELVCRPCRDRRLQCSICAMYHDRYDFVRTPSEGRICYSCEEAQRALLRRRDVQYARKGFTKASERKTLGFGTEIEVEFPDGPPFPTYGYHNSDSWATEPFLGGWKSETDGSLSRGAEIISPVLNGATGLAEVLATFDVLRECGGEMRRSCGGHITVSTPGPKQCVQAQRLFTIFEEVAFALTGSWSRYRDGSYATPLKNPGIYDNMKGGSGDTSRMLTAHSKSVCVEYRYPPGTLNDAQFTINLGLCQLVTALAINLSDKQVRSIFNEGVQAYDTVRHGPMATQDRAHQFVLYGLSVLYQHGWRSNVGGSEKRGPRFVGLPYMPSGGKAVTVRDESRNLRYGVALPTQSEITDRMESQLEKFYWKMFRGRGQDGDRRARYTADAVSMVRGTPTEAAEETLTNRVPIPLIYGVRQPKDVAGPVLV